MTYQRCNALLAIGGDRGNQVPKLGVTPAEILVLQEIHGVDAVSDVEIVEEDSNLTRSAVLAHIRETYGSSKNLKGERIVEKEFTRTSVVPASLSDLEFPQELMRATQRASQDVKSKPSRKGRAAITESGPKIKLKTPPPAIKAEIEAQIEEV